MGLLKAEVMASQDPRFVRSRLLEDLLVHNGNKLADCGHPKAVDGCCQIPRGGWQSNVFSNRRTVSSVSGLLDLGGPATNCN